MELWQLMHPAAGRIKTRIVTPLVLYRRWRYRKSGEITWFARYR